MPISNGGDSDGLPMSTTVQSSSSPAFTGTLKLQGEGGPVGPAARLLLSVPGGIHFRKLSFAWTQKEDISPMMALVEKCSHTLESLYVWCDVPGTFIRHLRPHR